MVLETRSRPTVHRRHTSSNYSRLLLLTTFVVILVCFGLLRFREQHRGVKKITNIGSPGVGPEGGDSDDLNDSAQASSATSDAACLRNGISTITIAFQGELGDDMFQYAALLGIAKMSSRTPVLSSALFSTMSPVFPEMDITICPISEDWHIMVFDKSISYDKRIDRLTNSETRNIALRGYFLGWKYFHEIKDVVRQQFTFADRLQQKVNMFLQSALYGIQTGRNAKNVTFIGVHIRKGELDLKRNPRIRNSVHVVSSASYVSRAMDYYENKYKSRIIFVVCSDDMAWATQHVKPRTGRVVFSTFADVESDLCLLASCNHTIMTQGSFGWWAGWLAGGEVVYDGAMRNGLTSEDLYPPNWIPL